MRKNGKNMGEVGAGHWNSVCFSGVIYDIQIFQKHTRYNSRRSGSG